MVRSHSTVYACRMILLIDLCSGRRALVTAIALAKSRIPGLAYASTLVGYENGVCLPIRASGRGDVWVSVVASTTLEVLRICRPNTPPTPVGMIALQSMLEEQRSQCASYFQNYMAFILCTTQLRV
jgi:hypothetical protein